MQQFTSYDEVMDFLYAQLPMYQRQGKPALKKDLGNIKALCAHLDHPQENFKSIHIAGTNGKGSTAHFITTFLMEMGFSVGLYTSPHYVDFRERISVDGQLIEEEEVVNFTQKILPSIAELSPSFFEITVPMAFDYFDKRNVDFAVVETGLGGRLDSTNILSPELSVITNISMDHQNTLGNTLQEIAREKAGIIKANIPVLIGRKQKDLNDVFESIAKKKNSPLRYAKDILELTHREGMGKNIRLHFVGDNTVLDCTCSLQGKYQLENLGNSLAAIINLLESHPDITMPDFLNAIPGGMSKLGKVTPYYGRWQVVDMAPPTILDSAHNEQGIRNVFKELQDYDYEVLHIILGFVNDKEYEKILKSFPKAAEYYLCKADIPRGLNVSELEESVNKQGFRSNSYRSVSEAYRSARRTATKYDCILVTGSIFIVAEVLDLLRKEDRNENLL